MKKQAKKKTPSKRTRAKKATAKKPRAQKRGKSSTAHFVTVKEIVGFGRMVKLTPAVVATLIKVSFEAEDMRAGGKGKLTLRKARGLAKKHKLNKKVLAALEVRVRRSS